MKIAFVHNAYGRPSGEEVVVDNLMASLREQRQEIVTFFRSSAEIPDLRFGSIHAFFSGIYNPWSRRAFGGFLERERPDVVHVHNVFPLISPSILPECRQRRVPVVMTLHNFRLICPNGLLLRDGRICHDCLGGHEYYCVAKNCERDLPRSFGYSLRTAVARRCRWFLDNVDRFICLTNFQRDVHVQNGLPADRCIVIPNAIPRAFLDAQLLTSSESEKESSFKSKDAVEGAVARGPRPRVQARKAGETYVGCVMRISPEKDVETLFEAAKRLPDIPFKIAGATERMPELVARAPVNVECVGHLGPQALKECYAGMRLMVFPTRCYEGMPVALLEAAAMGIPTVCTRIGGLPEIVNIAGASLLYELGDAVGLAECVGKLWEAGDLARRLAEQAAVNILRTLHPERVCDQHLSVYQTVCGELRSGLVMSATDPPTAEPDRVIGG